MFRQRTIMSMEWCWKRYTEYTLQVLELNKYSTSMESHAKRYVISLNTNSSLQKKQNNGTHCYVTGGFTSWASIVDINLYSLTNPGSTESWVIVTMDTLRKDVESPIKLLQEGQKTTAFCLRWVLTVTSLATCIVAPLTARNMRILFAMMSSLSAHLFQGLGQLL